MYELIMWSYGSWGFLTTGTFFFSFFKERVISTIKIILIHRQPQFTFTFTVPQNVSFQIHCLHYSEQSTQNPFRPGVIRSGDKSRSNICHKSSVKLWKGKKWACKPGLSYSPENPGVSTLQTGCSLDRLLGSQGKRNGMGGENCQKGEKYSITNLLWKNAMWCKYTFVCICIYTHTHEYTHINMYRPRFKMRLEIPVLRLLKENLLFCMLTKHKEKGGYWTTYFLAYILSTKPHFILVWQQLEPALDIIDR